MDDFICSFENISQFTLQICFVPITVMQCFREFVWCTIILNIKKDYQLYFSNVL